MSKVTYCVVFHDDADGLLDCTDEVPTRKLAMQSASAGIKDEEDRGEDAIASFYIEKRIRLDTYKRSTKWEKQ